MATYRALRNVSGKTAFNGVYPFTIKQGELVEADKAGGSWLNIKLPGAAPTPQQYAPIAKLPGNNFELVGSASGSAAPSTNQTKAPAAPVNLAKEGSKFFSNLWIPVVGANLGMFAGTYYAWRKGSGTWGFIGWSALGSLAGILVSAPIVVVRVKSQASSISKKLDKGSATASSASSGGNIAQMKAAIVEANVKEGMDKAATEEWANKLTEKEVQSVYLTLKMPDKAVLMQRFPDLFKTPPTNEAEAQKLFGTAVEKVEGDYGISGLTGPEFIASSQSAIAKMFS